VTLALAAAGTAGFGYTKRQTLKLASELDRARAQGATTFDQLDTCVAAHQLSQQRARDCTEERTRIETANRQALSSLEADSDAVERELNRRLGAAKRQTRTCEKEHSDATEAWDDERSSLTTALADEKTRHTELETALASTVQKATDLEKELERQNQARKACENTNKLTSESRDECREDLASCIQDRDTCTAEPDVAQQPPRSPPSPAIATPPAPGKPAAGSAGEGKSSASAPQP
jgi:chromosome segregation ATPase